MNYSVLMSVYHKEDPEHLRASIQSMFDQTFPTDDFVLYCDGSLNEGLDEVIGDFQQKFPDVFRVIRSEENHGLGFALGEGIKHCKNELVARMDSDDISRKDRCEKEVAVFEEDPSLSIVGSNISEFSVTPDNPDSLRCVPEKNEDIRRFAKRRSPFNHPSVMFRKSDVLRCGNYSTVRYMQDYYLWVAMLINGCKGYNIQEPLVYMRADGSLFKRRSGKQYRKIQLDLFRYMKDKGFISFREYLSSCIIRVLSAAAPNGLRRFVFKRILRKGV